MAGTGRRQPIDGQMARTAGQNGQAGQNGSEEVAKPRRYLGEITKRPHPAQKKQPGSEERLSDLELEVAHALVREEVARRLQHRRMVGQRATRLELTAQPVVIGDVEFLEEHVGAVDLRLLRHAASTRHLERHAEHLESSAADAAHMRLSAHACARARACV